MNEELDPSLKTKIAQLREQKKKAILGGGEKRIADQHAKGKLTARERLNLLLDEGSFVETDTFAVPESANSVLGDGVVTGHMT